MQCSIFMEKPDLDADVMALYYDIHHGQLRSSQAGHSTSAGEPKLQLKDASNLSLNSSVFLFDVYFV